MTPSPEEIASLAAATIFGKPLVTNVYRSILVEAMVSQALAPRWAWCSADYASWDFEHTDGTHLEVKQSAAKQSWESPKPSAIGWDIAARKGVWEGHVWRSGAGRNAHIYVLAFNPIIDTSADHRDPKQWQFFVIEEVRLPQTKRLSFAQAKCLATAVMFDQLSAAVENVCRQRVP